MTMNSTMRLGAGLALVLSALSAAGCANSGRTSAGCDPACPTFYQCCDVAGDAVCADIVNDARNCGGCGTVCPSGVCREAACQPGSMPGVDGSRPMPGVDAGPSGMCSPTCSASQRCCGTTCVSRTGVAPGTNGRTDSSFSSCNGCGIACDADAASACSVPGGGAGTPRCMCGIYDQCPSGQSCVADGSGSFTCVNTDTDPMNCGSIGRACADGESCTAGVCACGTSGSACSAGQACCGGACINAASDAANCGACGRACSAGESCSAGVCGCGSTGRPCRAPTPGMIITPGDPGESCCGGACVANTDTNCACMACTGDDTCQVGGGGLPLPGMMTGGTPQVCCGGPEVALLGCGGGGFPGGGDGGLPFPFP